MNSSRMIIGDATLGFSVIHFGIQWELVEWDKEMTRDQSWIQNFGNRMQNEVNYVYFKYVYNIEIDF